LTRRANRVAASSALLFGDLANLTAPLLPLCPLDLTNTCQLAPQHLLVSWGRNVANSWHLNYASAMFFGGALVTFWRYNPARCALLRPLYLLRVFE
jgi:hypothetical protein